MAKKVKLFENDDFDNLIKELIEELRPELPADISLNPYFREKYERLLNLNLNPNFNFNELSVTGAKDLNKSLSKLQNFNFTMKLISDGKLFDYNWLVEQAPESLKEEYENAWIKYQTSFEQSSESLEIDRANLLDLTRKIGELFLSLIEEEAQKRLKVIGDFILQGNQYEKQSAIINKFLNSTDLEENSDQLYERIITFEDFEVIKELILNSTLSLEKQKDLFMYLYMKVQDNEKIQKKQIKIERKILEQHKQNKGTLETLVEEIEDEVTEEVQPVEEIIESIEETTEKINYTEEQKQILNKINKLLKEHLDYRVDEENTELAKFMKYSDTRLYAKSDIKSVDWNVIINDIIQVLQPGLKNATNIEDVNNIFDRFKDILKLDEEYKENKSKMEEVTFNITNLLKYKSDLDSITEEDNLIINYIRSEMPVNNIVDILIKKGISTPIEYYNYLKELQDNAATINSLYEEYYSYVEAIDQENLIFTRDELWEECRINSLVEILKLNFEDVYKKFQEKMLQQSKEQGEIYIPKHTSFLLYDFLNIDTDQFIEKSYVNDGSENVTVGTADVLEKMIHIFENGGSLGNPLQIGHKNQSGKIIKYKFDGVTPWRIHVFNNRYRFGYLTVDVAKENTERIKKRFKLPKFQNILIYLGIIYGPQSQDHDINYKLFENILNNRQLIGKCEELSRRLSDPNISDDELFGIVEEAVKFHNVSKGLEEGGIQK